MDTLECIKSRRSVRKFQSTPVSSAQVEQLAEAGQWAPSWNNCKAVRYTALENPAMLKRISETLVAPENAAIVGNAPLLIALSIVKKRSGYERDGTTSTAKGASWEMFDTGVACQNLCLAAHSIGLGTCIMASFHEEGVAELIDLPEEETLIALVACGYPESVPTPPRRKKVGEILRYRS
ncbi:MAG: nitroreductase family protein [Pseudoflavonifractor sp.]|nr:nitroreductase family protein [Pseudoflavonifractor sp.]